uniref:Uncharacterized protein n=1 Tax=Arundo donax TaxID=35708 RepID=A0A0A8YXT1_ARUDO
MSKLCNFSSIQTEFCIFGLKGSRLLEVRQLQQPGNQPSAKVPAITRTLTVPPIHAILGD